MVEGEREAEYEQNDLELGISVYLILGTGLRYWLHQA